MPEPLMPQGCRRGCSEGLVVWEPERVEIAAALTSEHLRPGRKILYGKTRRVKFNGHIVITSQSTNRDEVLDKRRRNKDIVQM
jgi:hypothetical protein